MWHVTWCNRTQLIPKLVPCCCQKVGVVGLSAHVGELSPGTAARGREEQSVTRLTFHFRWQDVFFIIPDIYFHYLRRRAAQGGTVCHTAYLPVLVLVGVGRMSCFIIPDISLHCLSLLLGHQYRWPTQKQPPVHVLSMSSAGFWGENSIS